MSNFIYKGFYLLSIKNGQVVSWDGNHSKKHGVVKALEIYQRLNLGDPSHTYLMAKVKKDLPYSDCSYKEAWQKTYENNLCELSQVPKEPVVLNEEAVSYNLMAQSYLKK